MDEALVLLDDPLLPVDDPVLLGQLLLLLAVLLLELEVLLNHEHLLLLEDAHRLLGLILEELDLGLACVLLQRDQLDLVRLADLLDLIVDLFFLLRLLKLLHLGLRLIDSQRVLPESLRRHRSASLRVLLSLRVQVLPVVVLGEY